MPPRPLVTIMVVVAWIALGLWLDSHLGLRGQLLLGAATALVLVALLASHSPAERLQTFLVVVVASGAEVVGSILWGVYTYRLENLPAFVPPGHGLVFIGGLALARVFGRWDQALVVAGTIGVVGWGIVSLVALPAPDVTGAIGCTTLAAVLVATRRPVYAGVFFVVAFLELYGTAIGTWTWASTVPGLGLPQGNPPSGVASGYVLFDVVALLTAPLLVQLSGRARRSAAPPPQTAAAPASG
jgi:hypothetical protein